MDCQVAKLGHVALITPDLQQSLWFFRDVVGLEVSDEQDETVFLRAWDEREHHSLSLSPGPEAAVDHVGWRTRQPEDVDRFAARLDDSRVEVTEVPAGQELGQGRAIRFRLPAGGHSFELYYDVEKPAAPEGQRSPLKTSNYRAWDHGISPRRIDHVNIITDNTQATEECLQDLLGFQTRERARVDGEILGSWMAITSLSHDISILRDAERRPARFHHVAYYLDNYQDLLRGLDILAEHRIDVDSGPGRHGISQAVYSYVRDPASGHRVELFSGGYHVFDPDWEPVEWCDDEVELGMVLWGEHDLSRLASNTPFAQATTNRRG
jgi:catechol 2,3 dioxygenase